MSNHVYKQIDLVGSSTKSTDDAISQAIERASETLRNLDWFEVTEVRGGYQFAVDQTIEIEGAEKPAVVARGLYRFYA